MISTDDGLEITSVGPWSEKKYGLIGVYDELFSRGMKNRWTRVYIDLFAGSGKARIETTGRIVLGSPLISLEVPDRFDKYIFCERDETKRRALESRILQGYRDADVSLLGDCNEHVDEILRLIPKHSASKKVLTLCFVDPYSLNLEYETIRKLSGHFVDFLILLALSMDGVRNEALYVEKHDNRIDRFLGDSTWRLRWDKASLKDPSFLRFLAKEYVGRMIGLGFSRESLKTMVPVRSDKHNLPLYHLAFFSRNPKGYEFWRKTIKYHSDQTVIEFD